jgi:hypothetical protein
VPLAGNSSVRGMNQVGHSDDRASFSDIRFAAGVELDARIAAAGERRLRACHAGRIRELLGAPGSRGNAELGRLPRCRAGRCGDVDPLQSDIGGCALHLQKVVLGPRDHGRGAAVGVQRGVQDSLGSQRGPAALRDEDHHAGLQRQPCAAGPGEAAGLQAGRHAGAKRATRGQVSGPGGDRFDEGEIR